VTGDGVVGSSPRLLDISRRSCDYARQLARRRENAATCTETRLPASPPPPPHTRDTTPRDHRRARRVRQLDFSVRVHILAMNFYCSAHPRPSPSRRSRTRWSAGVTSVTTPRFNRSALRTARAGDPGRGERQAPRTVCAPWHLRTLSAVRTPLEPESDQSRSLAKRGHDERCQPTTAS